MSNNETESSKANGPKAEVIGAAVDALRRGEVVVFPTETLYGLGADAFNSAAVEKILELKGRDPGNPIPVLVADRRMLDGLVVQISPLAEALLLKFWPGPLTIVLPARADIPRPLVNSRGGVGVRISISPIAAKLVEKLGRPLTATSANPSGQAPARTVEEAKNFFAGKIDLFIDGGELISKTGSTVVEIRDNSLAIVREGEIDKVELERAIGKNNILP